MNVDKLVVDFKVIANSVVRDDRPSRYVALRAKAGTNTLIVDGPLAVSQLLSALPAIIREDCDS